MVQHYCIPNLGVGFVLRRVWNVRAQNFCNLRGMTLATAPCSRLFQLDCNASELVDSMH